MDTPRSTVEVQIVPFTGEYLDDVEKIENACFSLPWSREAFVEVLSNPLAVFTVAVADGHAVGYAGMYHILNEGQITNIAVLPERRGAGVASEIFEYLLSYAKENGVEYLTLEVRDSNEAARAMYEKFGFEPVGVRENYYSAPGKPPLLMTKEI